MIPFFGSEDIRPYLDIEALIPTAEAAFRAITNRTAQAPAYILHPNDWADIHVKSASLPGCPIFTIKMAGWSQVLADRGETASSGMIAIFDSKTCKPLALLQDDHLLSDYRTAAAGALAVQKLSSDKASSALIIGTGVQGKLQAEGVMRVRPIKHLKIWGRSKEKASALAQDLQSSHPGVEIRTARTLPLAIADAKIIITATSAKEPVVMADWVYPEQLIISVGSDDTTKCEIDPTILRNAEIYVDSVDAASKYGVPHRAIDGGIVSKDGLIEIGSLKKPRGKAKAKITVACLSGFGIQDLTAVNALWPRLQCTNR